MKQSKQKISLIKSQRIVEEFKNLQNSMVDLMEENNLTVRLTGKIVGVHEKTINDRKNKPSIWKPNDILSIINFLKEEKKK